MKTFHKIIVPVSLGALGLVIFSSYSVGIPRGAVAVKNFDIKKYLGKWYEIARFDYRFEKNMDNVTAEYSENSNGTVQVKNKGYDYVKKVWNTSIGEAKFVKDPTEARLKVSFFKPFWAGYNVIDIDDEYQYALVVGSSLKYLWILSRTTVLPESIRQRFLEKARKIGYNTDELIWVKHNQ
ncbi:lipocalin family protein [Chryseobacterium gallinarum]|uniref:Outer membrane lipoprotein Blc n=1 Tax=Chryseobacterium gallinarum TaxID=1324352 RepID=A0A0G3M6Y1_CHRGL|nr:lipocalin family protein [Chryseobacterium gallinarum]AKK74941.1 lipocalin [Chryseobacterium gallinarum]MCL8537216.1 lipocalin family protein [Chryseobacterium gallinarum]QIY90705.1 lipocalin [Chryseobacterium gallinarum]